MIDVLSRHWKPRLVCLGLAVVVWYSVKHGGRNGLPLGSPILTAPATISESPQP